MVREVFLVFSVAEQRFALPVEGIERVVAAAETTPLPDAPPFVLGVVNVGGEAAPVVDLRQRLGAPRRDMLLSDRFLLVRDEGRLFALLVDGVEGVCALEPQDVSVASGEDARVALSLEEHVPVALRHIRSLLAPSGDGSTGEDTYALSE
ncbi:chemotaxis protein CheW [Aminiphilus sp.]|uniref:chemotaxis protein CheW n=1 Tax=Aminiphilus sp. TaxID=1872488 RepID=UPI002637771B|nr:chemotaxis protein CheW [Aminiphilus sp.]